jgi:phosphotriesterase-related protein
MDLLEQAGADLGRTTIGHLDRTVFRRETLREIAGRGCFLEWDLFGLEQSLYVYNRSVDMPNDAARMDAIEWAISEGYGDRIVIAQDICHKNQLLKYGGHGYAYILAHIVPRMRARGFAEAAIHGILVDNPAAFLTFAEARA